MVSLHVYVCLDCPNGSLFLMFLEHHRLCRNILYIDKFIFNFSCGGFLSRRLDASIIWDWLVFCIQ